MAKEKTKTETAAGEIGGAGKPGKPGKPPKRPKPGKKGAAMPLNPGEGDGKGKKKGGKSKRGKKMRRLVTMLVIIFIVLIIIAGAAFVLITNQFELRDKAFDYIYTLDPRDRAREKTLEDRQNDLDDMEQELYEREETILLREEELDQRENDIRAEEASLKEIRKQLDEQEEDLEKRELESVPRYMQPMTEEELADMQNLAKIYATMAPDQAAAIMNELYIKQDMAAILYHMSTRSASAILAAMDVTLAADITDILLNE